jgi:hypothetical protein
MVAVGNWVVARLGTVVGAGGEVGTAVEILPDGRVGTFWVG